MALTSGTKLGPYEIQSPLGVGGMGEVYRARDTRLDRTVAVKILSSQMSESAEAKQRGGVSRRMTFGSGVWRAWSVWSPDGKYIAYSARSEGKVSIARTIGRVGGGRDAADAGVRDHDLVGCRLVAGRPILVLRRLQHQ